MLVYKKKDLQVEHESSYGYTTTPAHHLQSITASAIWFFSNNTSQTQPQAHSADVPHTNVDGNNEVLEKVRHELDSYLNEPKMPHIRFANPQMNTTAAGGPQPADPEVCDPLRYWKVRIFLPPFKYPSPVYRVLKLGSHTSFGSQWTSSLHKHQQLLASGCSLQVQKHAPVVETALIQNLWKPSRH